MSVFASSNVVEEAGPVRSGDCRPWATGILRSCARGHTRVKMSANENTSSPSKRQRLDKREIEREGGRSSLLSCLELIPLEILAEVLSYVNSPKDVLSVARCSKHLCATLLNPSNVIIWRRARRHCVVPGLPAPLPGWSESAYAAFVFDEGHCYVRHGHFTTQIIMIDVTPLLRFVMSPRNKCFGRLSLVFVYANRSVLRLFLMDILLRFTQHECRRKLLECVIIMFLINQCLPTDFGGQVIMLVSRIVHTAAVRIQNRAFFKTDLDI
jgi:hypothetical protein